MRFYCTSTGPMGGLNCEVDQTLCGPTYIMFPPKVINTEITVVMLPTNSCHNREWNVPEGCYSTPSHKFEAT